ncbi:MAG TPA: BON domain-containing protein [Waddliaceae bacterium]
MKKIVAIFILTSCASLLQADYSNGNAQGNNYPSQTQRMQNQSPGNGYSSSYESTQTKTMQSKSQNGGASKTQNGSSDQVLYAKIQNALSNSSYMGKYDNVTASVSNGNVTLQGSVNSQDDKNTLGAIVAGIDGVKSVTNQVTVQGGNGSQKSGKGYSSSSNSSSSYQSKY